MDQSELSEEEQKPAAVPSASTLHCRTVKLLVQCRGMCVCVPDKSKLVDTFDHTQISLSLFSCTTAGESHLSLFSFNILTPAKQSVCRRLLELQLQQRLEIIAACLIRGAVKKAEETPQRKWEASKEQMRGNVTCSFASATTHTHTQPLWISCHCSLKPHKSSLRRSERSGRAPSAGLKTLLIWGLDFPLTFTMCYRVVGMFLDSSATLMSSSCSLSLSFVRHWQNIIQLFICIWRPDKR